MRMPSANDLGADGHDHEFLEVDLVVGVLAAVDDVGHRHGQDAGVGAADVAVERQAVGGGGRLGGGQADAQDRVGAELPLVRACRRRRSARGRARPGRPGRGRRRPWPARALTLATALVTPFAEVPRLVAVAELDRLVDAGAGPRGDRRAAERAVGQDHVDLDGRVAAAVEDLAPADLGDRSKLADSWLSSSSTVPGESSHPGSRHPAPAADGQGRGAAQSRGRTDWDRPQCDRATPQPR